MSRLLEVRGLAKHFEVRGRRLRALDGISFDLERGRTLALVGESGSGKTTAARCIVGLERASAGSVVLDGAPLAGFTRRVQMVFQDPYASLDPRQSVRSIVEEPLAIHRLGSRPERRRRAEELLESVGLPATVHERRPHELSGGQRQRVAIARALAPRPDVLVCDEPVSALDVSVQAQVVELLRGLQERLGMAMLFIAHDLALVRHLAHEVAVMYLGRIVEHDAVEDVLDVPAHPYTRALLSAVPVPDPRPEARRPRVVLAGEPPSPLAVPEGCRFHPRCPDRERVPRDRCRHDDPGLALRAGRRFACHLAPAASPGPGAVSSGRSH